MKRYALLCGALAIALGLTGCVEHRYVIESCPPGAVVQVNGQPLDGATPVDGSYIFNGAYDFTLIKPGYETLNVHQSIPPKWYEYPPLDFISENMVPWTIRDVRRFSYQLQPQGMPVTAEVVQRAQELQAKGKMIGPPAPPTPPVSVAPPITAGPPGAAAPVTASGGGLPPPG